MIAAFFGYTFLALCLFYMQNLVFFPHVHLRLLSLLLFYVALRPSLGLALALALALGALQDSFRHHPLRVASGRGPAAGGGGPVFPATAALATPQLPGAGHFGGPESAGVLHADKYCDSGIRRFFVNHLFTRHLAEILGTAALGPLMYLLVRGMENFLRHFGWRPSDSSPYQPFS